MIRECLDCGMSIGGRIKYCPKCDADLMAQTDGSVLTVDIAHHGERVHEAMRKLDGIIAEAKHGYTHSIRLIVGRGLIRDEVQACLAGWQRSRKIRDFGFDNGNEGVIAIILRRSERR